MTTKEDLDRIKRLKQFENKLRKLLAQYPEVRLYGDMNGDVKGHSKIGSGHGTRPIVTDQF